MHHGPVEEDIPHDILVTAGPEVFVGWRANPVLATSGQGGPRLAESDGPQGHLSVGKERKKHYVETRQIYPLRYDFARLSLGLFLGFAHRAFCARLILLRAAADSLRVPFDFADPLYVPTKAVSAAFRADNCFSTRARSSFNCFTNPDRFAILSAPRVGLYQTGEPGTYLKTSHSTARIVRLRAVVQLQRVERADVEFVREL